MLVGHCAVAFAVKRAEPKLSLGTAMLAALFIDLLYCVFLFAGWEQLHFKPGKGAANYLDLASSNVALSHSLVMDFVWAALFAGAFLLVRRDVRGACLVFAAVLSHWILDWISWPPHTLPVWHGRSGLGLWTSVPATIAIEGGLWLVAVVWYARTGKVTGKIVFGIGVVLLTLAWYNNIAGPPPPDPSKMAISSLIFFSLIIGWAYWIDRRRTA